MNTFLSRASSVRMLALIKDETYYEWFRYNGRDLNLRSRGGSTLILETGGAYGVRKSHDGKQIRMIAPETGPTKVFTLDLDTANLLAKKSIALKKSEIQKLFAPA